MLIPDPVQEVIARLKKMGFRGSCIDPMRLMDPSKHGTLFQNAKKCVRMLYDPATKRFYLSHTNRPEPEEAAYFDSLSPQETAEKLFHEFGSSTQASSAPTP